MIVSAIWAVFGAVLLIVHHRKAVSYAKRLEEAKAAKAKQASNATTVTPGNATTVVDTGLVRAEDAYAKAHRRVLEHRARVAKEVSDGKA